MAFWNRNKNRGREPTADKPNTSEQYKMVISNIRAALGKNSENVHSQ